MKTRLFTLLLAIVAGIGTMHATIVTGTCGENLTWSLNTEDSTLTITGLGVMYDWAVFEDNPAPWHEYNNYIAHVNLPEGLTNIGQYAFYECGNLLSVVVPVKVTSIGIGAFERCDHMVSAELHDNITRIGDGAFMYCDSLKSIHIPKSVTRIEYVTFHGCKSLTSIQFPENITRIGQSAFGECIGLTSVAIPDKVSYVDWWAFVDCSNLTTITLGKGVEGIGNAAFANCDKLKSITSYATTPPTLEWEDVFMRADKSIPVYVPFWSIDSYKTADVWKEFTNISRIEMPKTNCTVNYLDKSGDVYDSENVALRLTEAPEIEGFTFLKWAIVAGDLEDGINIQAVYQKNTPMDAPAVYTNPANPAQKLIRNGNVYILTEDHTYTITGQEVK